MARYNFGTFGFDNRMVGDFEKVEDQMYRPPAPMYNEGIQTLVNTYAPPTDIDTQAAKQVARAAQTNLPAQNLANQQANAFRNLLVNSGVIAPPEGTDTTLPSEDPTTEYPVKSPPTDVEDPPLQEPPMYDPVYPEEPRYGLPDDYFYDLDNRTRDELINMPPVITPYTPAIAPLSVENFSNPNPVTSLVTNPYTGLNTRPHNYSTGGLVKYSHGGLHADLNPDISTPPETLLPPTLKQRLNSMMYALEDVGTAKVNPYSPVINRGLDITSKIGIEDPQGIFSLIGGASDAANRVVSGAVDTVIPGGRRPIKDLIERRRARQAQKQAEIEENIAGLTNTGRRDN
jgi:hypothetical protein